MKTNQLMQVCIGDFKLPIEHLSMMGSLTELWNYGNSIRLRKGLGSLDLKNYLRERETLEFINVVERYTDASDSGKIKLGAAPDLELSPQKNTGAAQIPTGSEDSKCVNPTHFGVVERQHIGTYKIENFSNLKCIKTKRGKTGGTWAHLYILLDAASQLDAEFKFQIYHTFVTNKILQWRDESGDQFKAINLAVDAYLPGREGKDSNKGIYINISNMLKSKINPTLESWNVASYQELESRSRYETQLIGFLKANLIKDWDHLKEVIDKL